MEQWRRSGWQGDNAELWNRLAAALVGADVQVVKVKGDARTADVRAGRVKAEDKCGNDVADRLVVAGPKPMKSQSRSSRAPAPGGSWHGRCSA